MKKKEHTRSGKFREKAESLLKKKQSEKSDKYSEADVIKLNHELQVHQIELELMNEELFKAKEQAEAAAKKYSELYYAPLGYFTLSKKNEIIDVNPTGSQMLGGGPEHLRGKSFSSYVAEESQSIFDLFIIRVFKTKTIQTCDLSLTVKDKAPVYIYMNGLININRTHCHLVAIDITDRKKAEREYQRLLDEFRSTQIKLNVALESGNIGIWEWDLNAGEITLDDKSETLFGLKSGKFGHSLSAFNNTIHEDDRPLLQNAFNQAIKNNEPIEVILRTKGSNLSIRYLNVRAYIRKDPGGKPLRFTGVCYDITGLKETEQTILKLNEELIRSNKDLEKFAYVASHDLQEPLRMVTSFMQLLASRYENKLDNDAREYIGFAVEGARRMYDLLNGLLTYSRLSSKGHEFSRVDMNQVLDRVTRNLHLIIDERKAVIKSDKLPVVHADEHQMLQIFQNLIVNAIKFSESPPRVYVTSRTENSEIVFSVRDEGMGIEQQYYERIFQIFQRLVSRNDIPGIGIGLSICKRIIERHKGKIWVESEPGKGSVFSFSLPVHDDGAKTD